MNRTLLVFLWLFCLPTTIAFDICSSPVAAGWSVPSSTLIVFAVMYVMLGLFCVVQALRTLRFLPEFVSLRQSARDQSEAEGARSVVRMHAVICALACTRAIASVRCSHYDLAFGGYAVTLVLIMVPITLIFWVFSYLIAQWSGVILYPMKTGKREQLMLLQKACTAVIFALVTTVTVSGALHFHDATKTLTTAAVCMILLSLLLGGAFGVSSIRFARVVDKAENNARNTSVREEGEVEASPTPRSTYSHPLTSAAFFRASALVRHSSASPRLSHKSSHGNKRASISNAHRSSVSVVSIGSRLSIFPNIPWRHSSYSEQDSHASESGDKRSSAMSLRLSPNPSAAPASPSLTSPQGSTSLSFPQASTSLTFPQGGGGNSHHQSISLAFLPTSNSPQSARTPYTNPSVSSSPQNEQASPTAGPTIDFRVTTNHSPLSTPNSEQLGTPNFSFPARSDNSTPGVIVETLADLPSHIAGPSQATTPNDSEAPHAFPQISLSVGSNSSVTAQQSPLGPPVAAVSQPKPSSSSPRRSLDSPSPHPSSPSLRPSSPRPSPDFSPFPASPGQAPSGPSPNSSTSPHGNVQSKFIFPGHPHGTTLSAPRTPRQRNSNNEHNNDQNNNNNNSNNNNIADSPAASPRQRPLPPKHKEQRSPRFSVPTQLVPYLTSHSPRATVTSRPPGEGVYAYFERQNTLSKRIRWVGLGVCLAFNTQAILWLLSAMELSKVVANGEWNAALRLEAYFGLEVLQLGCVLVLFSASVAAYPVKAERARLRRTRGRDLSVHDAHSRSNLSPSFEDRRISRVGSSRGADPGRIQGRRLTSLAEAGENKANRPHPDSAEATPTDGSRKGQSEAITPPGPANIQESAYLSDHERSEPDLYHSGLPPFGLLSGKPAVPTASPSSYLTAANLKYASVSSSSELHSSPSLKEIQVSDSPGERRIEEQHQQEETVPFTSLNIQQEDETPASDAITVPLEQSRRVRGDSKDTLGSSLHMSGRSSNQRSRSSSVVENGLSEVPSPVQSGRNMLQTLVEDKETEVLSDMFMFPSEWQTVAPSSRNRSNAYLQEQESSALITTSLRETLVPSSSSLELLAPVNRMKKGISLPTVLQRSSGANGEEHNEGPRTKQSHSDSTRDRIRNRWKSSQNGRNNGVQHGEPPTKRRSSRLSASFLFLLRRASNGHIQTKGKEQGEGEKDQEPQEFSISLSASSPGLLRSHSMELHGFLQGHSPSSERSERRERSRSQGSNERTPPMRPRRAGVPLMDLADSSPSLSESVRAVRLGELGRELGPMANHPSNNNETKRSESSADTDTAKGSGSKEQRDRAISMDSSLSSHTDGRTMVVEDATEEGSRGGIVEDESIEEGTLSADPHTPESNTEKEAETKAVEKQDGSTPVRGSRLEPGAVGADKMQKPARRHTGLTLDFMKPKGHKKRKTW